jgi:predicted ABC-type ATPase
MAIPTLFVTGTCGVGKSTIAAEIYGLLAEADITNATVDLDALTWQWPHDNPFNRELKFENLAAIWPNYLAHGAGRLVLAGVLGDRSELARYEAAVPGAEITVCRLTAPQPLRIARLRDRIAPGPRQDWHVHRTVELEEILVQNQAEDYTVTNAHCAPADVAREVLNRIGWLPHR